MDDYGGNDTYFQINIEKKINFLHVLKLIIHGNMRKVPLNMLN